MAGAAAWLRAAALAAGLTLAACAPLPPARAPIDFDGRVLVFGEQHDQPAHQRAAAESVRALAGRQRLAALVLEMADQGRDTRQLPPDASESQVRDALGWTGWPWAVYADLVMAAVHAGVPVLGGNLPRARTRATMDDASLDARADADVRERLLQAVRQGHCGALPPARETGMLRVQVARDLAMADTLAQALRSARPGQLVVLHTGMQHASRDRGVPWHLAREFGLAPGDIRVVAFGGIARDAGLVVDEDRPAAHVARPDPCDGLADKLARPLPASAPAATR